MKKITSIVALVLLSFPGLSLSNQGSDRTTIPAINWPGHGGPPDESGYIDLKQINSDNVDQMGLAWTLDLPGEQTLEATPLAVNGVLYFTGSLADVYAVDAASGKLLWKHKVEIWKHNPEKFKYIFPINRGCAYDNGRIFSATIDGRLIALDAKTGELLWSTLTVPEDSYHMITGAPRTFNGNVIIGNGGADSGMRGYVTAYDQQTGKQVWRFYTVPGSPKENAGDPAMEKAAKTWAGEFWKTGTGGTVWNGMTFDEELNRIYLGTGNSGPYDPQKRSPGGGDNLYLASIVALDADSGEYLWHYQVNPREAWDYKATANMILATLDIDGKSRKVVMQSPTNGFFYVIDRETGELISAEKTGKVTWAERIDLKTGRPVEAADIRYEDGQSILWPSMFGTHNWQAMSFNPDTGLAYIPYMQLGMTSTRTPDSFLGVVQVPLIADNRDGKGELLAWDVSAQKPRWRVQHDWMWNGGTMTSGGNLVFQGTADGYFSAYNATTGERLWRFYTGLGIISAPISYSVAGVQYVSVLSGFGMPNVYGAHFSQIGWKYGLQPRRVLTFKLGVNKSLPPTAPPDLTFQPVDDPELVLDTDDVEAGKALFAGACIGCHGRDAVSVSAPGPDLRESYRALSLESFSDIVGKGLLLPRGMPQFENYSDEELRQMHAYIRARARER